MKEVSYTYTHLVPHPFYSVLVPGVPRDLLVTTISSTSLEVMWTASSTPQPSFSLHYHPTATADPTQLEAWLEATPPSSSPLAVVLEHLEPFTNYSVVVVASGRCGTVASAVVVALTLQDLSSPPINFSVVAVLPSRVKVQWSSPNHPNGIITSYNVSNPKLQPDKLQCEYPRLLNIWL